MKEIGRCFYGCEGVAGFSVSPRRLFVFVDEQSRVSKNGHIRYHTTNNFTR